MAREELRRTGGRPNVRDALTPTEQQVAEFAASGLRNREIASQMFLSRRLSRRTCRGSMGSSTSAREPSLDGACRGATKQTVTRPAIR